jgi:SOS-response transcriptional repressor LexA
MHPTQERLLELSQRYDLKKMGLRQIGRLIGVDHPQKVKFHLQKIDQLLDSSKKVPRKAALSKSVGSNLLSIPIVGLANCGEATMIAEDRIEGMLMVSPKMLSVDNFDSLFAVKAVGTSMDSANLNAKTIEDGDYVVVDGQNRDVKTGDYVLSVISGLANIKKYTEDALNHQIVLESESSHFFPPIHIHEEDLDGYIVNGKVVDVLKQPRNTEIRYEPLMGEY